MPTERGGVPFNVEWDQDTVLGGLFCPTGRRHLEAVRVTGFAPIAELGLGHPHRLLPDFWAGVPQSLEGDRNVTVLCRDSADTYLCDPPVGVEGSDSPSARCGLTQENATGPVDASGHHQTVE